MSLKEGIRASTGAGFLNISMIFIVIIILLINTSNASSGPSDESDNFQIDLPPVNNTIEQNLRALGSSDALLEYQSRQLVSLERNETMGLTVTPQRVKSLSEYERRLRDRAVRLARIEAQLDREWPHMNVYERLEKTKSLEDQLRRQANHLYSFQSHLKKSYCNLVASDKRKFLSSFEDLLDRQSELLRGFEDFTHRLQDAPESEQIDLLASFEDLIRRQAVLLEMYHNLLETECKGLKLNKYVKRCGKFRCGQNITYYYALESICNCTIMDIRILDDRLGYIAENITLGPFEKRLFEKYTILNYPSGKRVCNTAYAFGSDSDGLTISSASDRVCIKIAGPVLNQNIDSIILGDQKTIAIASDPAIAENSIIIKKNQNKEGLSNNDAMNQDSINAGDQLAGAYHNSRASNRIKIVSDQE